MLLREVVHATGQPAYGALPGESVEGYVNRFAAADLQKIRWNEN